MQHTKQILFLIIFLIKTLHSQVFFSYKVTDGKFKNLIFQKKGNEWHNVVFKLNFEEIKTDNPNEIILRNTEEQVLFKLTKGKIYYFKGNIEDYDITENDYAGTGDFSTIFPENITVSKKEIRYGESIELKPDEFSYLEQGDKWIWTTECKNPPCNIIQNDLILNIKPEQTTTYVFSSEKIIKKNIFIAINIKVDTMSISPKEIIIPDKICYGDRITLKINDGSLGKNCEWAWFDNPKLQHPLIVGSTSINIMAHESKVYYVASYKNGKLDSKPISKSINIQTKSTVNKLKSFPDLCIKYGLSIDLSSQKLGNGSIWYLTFDNPQNAIYEKTTTAQFIKLNTNQLLEFTKGKQKIKMNLQSKSDCFQSELTSTTIQLLDAGFDLNNLTIINSNIDVDKSSVTLIPKIDDQDFTFYTSKGVILSHQWYKKTKFKNKLISEEAELINYKVKKTTTFLLKVNSRCGSFETEYTYFK